MANSHQIVMRVSQAQKVVLFRSLSTLLNSGVGLMESFESLRVQVADPELVAMFDRIQGRIASGHNLSNTLSAEPAVFSSLVVALVRVGERSGKLHFVLTRVADLTESRDRLTRQLRSALIYPAFVLTLCLLLLIFAPVLVFSDLLDLLRELKTTLPITTKIYLGFSSLILSPWTYVVTIPLMAVAAWSLRRALTIPEQRTRLEEMVLSLQGLGPLLVSSERAMVSAAMAVCYESGLPILESLKLAGQASAFSVFRDQLKGAREALHEGEGLAEALGRTSLFEAQSLSLISTGEESGLVVDSLKMIAEESEKNTVYAVEAFQKLLEPCLLLLVGGIVGFIAIATLAPTLQMVDNL